MKLTRRLSLSICLPALLAVIIYDAGLPWWCWLLWLGATIEVQQVKLWTSADA
ncbi:MAG: hypothetical protein RBS46_02395 [Methyloversatilis sp.]|jgi:hypothetical protein|nr:hypothetical protein [Methyloversatilis sp.]